MNVIRLHTVLEHDGELVLTGLPYRKGQQIELIVFGAEDVEPQPLNQVERFYGYQKGNNVNI